MKQKNRFIRSQNHSTTSHIFRKYPSGLTPPKLSSILFLQFFSERESMLWEFHELHPQQWVTVSEPLAKNLAGLQGIIRAIRRKPPLKYSATSSDGPIEIWFPRCICDTAFCSGRNEGIAMNFLPTELEIAEALTLRSIHNFLHYVLHGDTDIDAQKMFATELKKERLRMNAPKRHRR